MSEKYSLNFEKQKYFFLVDGKAVDIEPKQLKLPNLKLVSLVEPRLKPKFQSTKYLILYLLGSGLKSMLSKRVNIDPTYHGYKTTSMTQRVEW